ncbi:DUF192 domain-containing protein [Asticcacaulis tiandongensis]|uniref:DUF192 domain-containing protein n=1 Tax=Asticcacaulis tiandongensis TaxID=2565365 RepID=UPI00112D70EC|nr:DUF192 domain-containing protein [Asticcacaulis tiandongensis]
MKTGFVKALILALALAGALPVSACAQTSAPVAKVALEPVRVVTADGVRDFKVEIADDEYERAKGLMYRESMPADHGMLFLFPDMAERSFWMHNTPLPLDIIYISSSAQVVSIQRNAIPYDRTPLPSFGAAVAVLEINGGLSDQLGIKPGDRIEHRFFEGKGPKPQ